MSKEKRGLFVTLEGPDGAGKTTQARILALALEAKGRRVLLTREPGGSPLSARIRRLVLDPGMRGLDPCAELLLFAADRRQHVADTLEPALKRGDVVLCDRFTDSTAAYQGAGRALARAEVEWIARFASHGLVPDLTLLYDLPAREGLRRAGLRRGKADRMEAGSKALFERVRREYLALARREPGRVKRIGVEGKSPERILEESMVFLEPLLRRP